MARLQKFSDAPILKSSLWQTVPVDCPPDSPKFVNAVVGLIPKENETPESLLKKLRELEKLGATGTLSGAENILKKTEAEYARIFEFLKDNPELTGVMDRLNPA